MFEKHIYTERRKNLLETFDSGLILFLGNDESPSNYSGNTYPFRQDSTFLYYVGLDIPGLAAVIDADSNTTTLFGTDFSIDDIVWMGPQPKVNQLAESSGITLNQAE
jgi:Xaa-Pro aminopeptidase